MRRIRMLSLTLSLVALWACTAFADNRENLIGLRDVIETVEKSFSDSSRYHDGSLFLFDARISFFQRTLLSGREPREMRADGDFFFMNADYVRRQPLKFRFDYYRPTSHEIISDGVSLWTYLPENRQVLLSEIVSFFKASSANPARNRGFNFLQGLPRISQDFRISFSAQRQDMNGNFILELTPRLSMATIEKLFIVVNNDSVDRYVQNGRQIIRFPNDRKADVTQSWIRFPLLSTTVIDHQGNATTMEFSNILTNVGLADLLFTFSIPANVQTLRPPGSERPR